MSGGVPVSVIRNSNPVYVRRRLDGIVDLARSIDKYGMRHPILTTPDYLIIDGARRLEASILLRHVEIPVIATNDWSEIIRRLTAARDERLPMSYLETLDLIRRILRPIEKTDRGRVSATSRRNRESAAGRRAVFANALGLSLTEFAGIQLIGSSLDKAEETHPGSRKRNEAYVDSCEQQGLRPATIAGHLYQYGGPPQEAKAALCPPKREQELVLDSTMRVLRVLGEDMAKNFPAMNSEFTVEEMEKLEREFYASMEKLRRVNTLIRKNIVEKKEKPQ